MPQQDFSKFDGSNPKLWIKRCDAYFDVYDIPPDNWVKLATINFTGTAAFWMQTIELNLHQCPWDSFYKHVVDRFDRDQFNHFIRQFFHVKQTASVAEYITLFDELMHQLLAHDPLVNPAFLTNKFIDGLADNIKAAILLHRPKDLDTASSLAILQEEIVLGKPHIGYKKPNSSGGQNKPFSKHSYFSTGNFVKANAQENPVTSASKPPIDEK
ncbi:uncharacterized protein [Miscanthus floridulus]|uniref:uncharacterized protein n=1 Tax=Miscanthus floridulus TaxID=154761 RepID=UPI00345AA64A